MQKKPLRLEGQPALLWFYEVRGSPEFICHDSLRTGLLGSTPHLDNTT